MILICALAILALMRDRPADIGLLPYGASEVTCEPEDPGSFAAMLVSPLLVLSGVSRSPTFWILFGTFFICGATTSGLVQTHLIAICGDFGDRKSVVGGKSGPVSVGSGGLRNIKTKNSENKQ